MSNPEHPVPTDLPEAPPRGTATTPGRITTPSPAPSSAPSNVAANSPAAGRRYVPQFSAATQLILKRMKGDPNSLSSALASAASSTVATNILKSSYDDVKRRLVSGLATTTSMTMQMPVATSPLPTPATPTLGIPAPPRLPATATTKPAVSAIRMISSGLTASGKVSTAKTPSAARTAAHESKAKKTKAPPPPKPPTAAKRKRAKGKDDEGGGSFLSPSDSDSSAPPPPKPAAVAAPTPPRTKTKSGRQVQKPETYNPATVDAHTKKRVNYGKRTAEQALCKKCSRLHSPASNQIVFCDGCNDGWHQTCHDPWIEDAVVHDATKSWFCGACVEKRARQHASKRQKVAVAEPGPPPRESWAAKTPQQRKAYLMTLSSQELVGLLMTSLELHPDLPIFPGTVEPAAAAASPAGTPRSLFAGATVEGLFPRVEANPTGQVNFIRKAGSGGRSSSGSVKQKGGKHHKEGSQEKAEDDAGEWDPLVSLWPRPGRGLYSRLPFDSTETEFLADESDFESFSVIVYDEKGNKIEENGMKVGRGRS